MYFYFFTFFIHFELKYKKNTKKDVKCIFKTQRKSSCRNVLCSITPKPSFPTYLETVVLFYLYIPLRYDHDTILRRVQPHVV